MAAKKTPRTAKRKNAKASRPPASGASTISMAVGNLINMVAVFAVSGAVLLTLLTVKYF